MKEKEIWKDIEGFEGAYQVGSFGNVRSLNRITRGRLFRGRVLKPGLQANEYYRVILSYKNNRVTDAIHRLVAKAFIPNPGKMPAVNHIDGNKLNNRVSNLEWVTHSKNSRHAVEVGLFDHISGEDSHLSRYRRNDILKVISLLKLGKSPSEVSRELSISRPMCSKLNLGKIWRPFLKSIGLNSFPIYVKPSYSGSLWNDSKIKKLLVLRGSKLSQKKISVILGISQAEICRMLQKVEG